MDILKKLLPNLEKDTKKREADTTEAVKESLHARRNAEADMIKAYKKMGYHFVEHDWSKR